MTDTKPESPERQARIAQRWGQHPNRAFGDVASEVDRDIAAEAE